MSGGAVASLVNKGRTQGGGHRHFLVVEPEQASLWSHSLPQFESCSLSSLSDTPASSSSRYMGSLGEQCALRNLMSLTTDATSFRPTMIWRNPLYPTWDPHETGQRPSEDNVKREGSTHPQCKCSISCAPFPPSEHLCPLEFERTFALW